MSAGTGTGGRVDGWHRRRPAPTEPNPHWRDKAACRAADPSVFFPDLPGRHNTLALQLAEATAHRWCARCPVAAACRADAEHDPGRAHGIRAGIWRRDNGDTIDLLAQPTEVAS